jgi:DNA end-binding protein Ku
MSPRHASHRRSRSRDDEGARSRGGARPTWKGSLKLSLIAIPIRVYPATSASSDVHFRQLHRRCHTPIQLKKWCPHCEEEVSSDDIVRGYESSKGHFVLVEEEEIKSLRPETTHVIDLSNIVERSSIGPIHVERTYFLTPDTRAAGSPFAVMRAALDGQAAVGRVALHGREYLVAVEPFDDALIMYTLRTAGEVRDLSATEGLEFAAEAKPRPDEVKLARQVLGTLDRATDITSFTDHYEEALKAMLAKKTGGEVVSVGAAPAQGRKVVDLMDALKQSLAAAGQQKKTPAKANLKKGSVVAHPSSRRARRAS